LKILYVIDQKPDGYPGGIEYHLLDLIRGFISNGKPVHVLFPERDSLRLRLYKDFKIEEFTYNGRRLDDHRLGDPEMEDSLSRILDEIDIDIVHIHSIRTIPLSFFEIAKSKKKKIVTTIHEYYFWCINCIMLAPDFCWFEKNEGKCTECLAMSGYKVSNSYVRERRQYINYIFTILDKVIVPSFYVKNVFLGLYEGFSSERCIVIENGIDRSLLLADDNSGKRSVKGRIDLAFLGNFLHYKGNKIFLELLEHYKNSDSVNFSIVGNIFDHALIPSHKNLNVIGGYSRDRVVETIRAAAPDLILLLSNWPETFSYTLSEAIASGTPVITTDGGALRERGSREGVGFLVPVEEPLPRVTEIIGDLAQNPEVIAFLREKVQRAKKRLLTVDDMIEKTYAVYNSMA
jgi:glycosyltransferase involved in cell wall biosynthesis